MSVRVHTTKSVQKAVLSGRRGRIDQPQLQPQLQPLANACVPDRTVCKQIKLVENSRDVTWLYPGRRNETNFLLVSAKRRS